MADGGAHERLERRPGGVVVQAAFFRRRGRAVEVSRAPIEERPTPAPRPLAVARMLALAHEIVRLIEDGTFDDQAHAARALGFTRARITQLVDLTLLAPEIQEEVLFAEVAKGRDTVSERRLRALVALRSWVKQVALKCTVFPTGSAR
jgi:predicted XRE-type DNA-binding protein